MRCLKAGEALACWVETALLSPAMVVRLWWRRGKDAPELLQRIPLPMEQTECASCADLQVGILSNQLPAS